MQKVFWTSEAKVSRESFAPPKPVCTSPNLCCTVEEAFGSLRPKDLSPSPIGRTPKGRYSSRGRSKHLCTFWNHPLLRTFSQNPSQNTALPYDPLGVHPILTTFGKFPFSGPLPGRWDKNNECQLRSAIGVPPVSRLFCLVLPGGCQRLPPQNPANSSFPLVPTPHQNDYINDLLRVIQCTIHAKRLPN